MGVGLERDTKSLSVFICEIFKGAWQNVSTIASSHLLTVALSVKFFFLKVTRKTVKLSRATNGFNCLGGFL